MPSPIPLSVVICAKNEEKNIEEALQSVYGWSDEIIVVDDNSTDRTAEVAKKYAKVLTRRMDNEGKHRNWAYSQARNLWVLSLDADEKVSDELKTEIAQAIKDSPHVSYDIPLRNYIGSYWVRHGGWYPASKVRLFRKDKFRYEEVQVHPRCFCQGTNGHLKGDIIHKGYPDIEHFISSLNRQTTLEAQKWFSTGRRFNFAHMLWRAIDRFFRRYVGKQGWRDGFYGFIIAYFASLYQFLSYIKYREMVNNKNEKGTGCFS